MLPVDKNDDTSYTVEVPIDLVNKYGDVEGLQAVVLQIVERNLPEGVNVSGINTHVHTITTLDELSWIRESACVISKAVKHMCRLECKVVSGGASNGGVDRLIASLAHTLSNMIDEVKHVYPHPLNIPCLIDPDDQSNPLMYTSLHMAVLNTAPVTLDTILKSRKADLNVLTTDGYTPLALLVKRCFNKNGAVACANLLISYMNDPGTIRDLTLPVPLTYLNELRQSGGNVLLALLKGYVDQIRKNKQEDAEKRAKATEKQETCVLDEVFAAKCSVGPREE